MVTIKAPKKGMKTEKPTRTDKRAVYCKPKYIKIIAAANQQLQFQLPLPLA